MEKKVAATDLKPGMYVARLDRPWLETPFLFQGFHVQSETDLEQLRRFCKYVYIDPEQGVAADHYLDDEPRPAPTPSERAPGPSRYIDTTPLQEELQFARRNQQQISESVGEIFDDVRAGRKINIAGMEATVNDMMESVLRNPDAYMWLTRLKRTDGYVYTHAIDASVMALAFGRHLGLDKRELRELAMGALLFDVGKMRLPNGLLNKPGKLNENEFRLVRSHVALGVELLRKSSNISLAVVSTAMTHHERFDGSGYPRGLRGDKIPLYGRIAAIVDCYDAMTSDRPYSRPISSAEAIRKLYEWRRVDFQEELVEQFIQCLGVYPVGSLVELSTGEVGIVISQNRQRRLRPRVMLVLDASKQPQQALPTIDLINDPTDADGHPIEISGALEEGAYGIDPKDFYL